jgi:hypothetical protein
MGMTAIPGTSIGCLPSVGEKSGFNLRDAVIISSAFSAV